MASRRREADYRSQDRRGRGFPLVYRREGTTHSAGKNPTSLWRFLPTCCTNCILSAVKSRSFRVSCYLPSPGKQGKQDFMNSITLKDFRCFHDRQTARLAPLTLLVGENSTGKTSFMAMIRALWDIAYCSRMPDFKEDPYDLGSFDEIAHHRGARGSQAHTFEAGFDRTYKASGRRANDYEITFGRSGTIPVLERRRFNEGSTWIKETFKESRPSVVRVGTDRGIWNMKVSEDFFDALHSVDPDMIWPFSSYLSQLGFVLAGSSGNDSADKHAEPLPGSPAISKQDMKHILKLASSHIWTRKQRPFASAPVRSKPRRTYDPSRPTPDPEGDYVPMYLANMYFRKKTVWEDLKKRLQEFGKASSLYDEISIKPLGKRDSEPFQVQVRKFGGTLKGPKKGPMRNLIDVGYGVSQVLPVITELLRQDAPPMFLLQQPEVHLHPRAQAALGSLFCTVASKKRQLVIETHSDHLLDRVRMEVRDGRMQLKPDDVSILFFERTDLDTHIHSLRLDEEGNIRGAPDGYRRFFMAETQRSLGL